jgi:hypothetical protein
VTKINLTTLFFHDDVKNASNMGIVNVYPNNKTSREQLPNLHTCQKSTIHEHLSFE